MARSSRRSAVALDALNFFQADLTAGVGPFLVVYLGSERHWDPGRIGGLMSLIGLVAIATQTPAGALVDRIRGKRVLLAAASAVIALGSLVTVAAGNDRLVFLAQCTIAAAGGVFAPAIAAISLGLVGRNRIELRLGRNQALNAAGNVLAAVGAGLIGYLWRPSGVFNLMAAVSLLMAGCALAIREREINYALARGADEGRGRQKVESLWRVFADRRLLVFAACAVLFHFANAAMLPLIGQLGGQALPPALAMSLYIVVAQAVMIPVGWAAGRWAHKLPRKPVFLIGFVALPLRGLLFACFHNAYALAVIQLLDGVGAGLFNVMMLLVIADLTRGTGRFNLAQGAIGTAVGLGAALSNWVGGLLALHYGFSAAFLVMTGVALLALLAFVLWMPETRGRKRAPRFSGKRRRAAGRAPARGKGRAALEADG